MKQVSPEQAAALREALAYDPDTGHFTWRVPRSKSRIGDRAGTVDIYGYIDLGFQERRYKAHRVAWLLTYGVWPAGEIDHINGIRSDNRIANLRVATVSQNRTGTTRKRKHPWPRGVKKTPSAWTAAISINGHPRHLGSFRSMEEASAAFEAASKQIRGEFYRPLAGGQNA